jgi:1,2-diacylglycerol 3-alpha-glucosyltransferase
MRIGMMVDAYKPYISGVTTYIELNKKALEQLGHEVFVFTFGDTDQVDQETNIIRTPGIKLVEKGFYLALSYTPKAKKLLQTMDIVHVHHPFTSGRLAVNYCKPLSIPIVFTNHTRYDLYIQTYLPMLPDGLGETFLQAYLPSFCRTVDLVISPSAGMEKVLRQQGVDAHIEIIPNGIDQQIFKQTVVPRKRADFGFSDRDVILIYAGRVAPEKNLPFLIHAFAGISAAYENARLLVIGDGPAKEDLEQTVQDLNLTAKVKFIGFIPHNELPGYLTMCDGFVTSSVTEVHPLSVIEAMTAGLPVLGIDSPGVGDTVEDGKTGFISSNNLAVYTAKMARLVSEPQLRQKLGSSANLAAEEYAIEKTVQKVLVQYQRLIAESSYRHRGFRFYLRSIWEKMRQ